MNIVQELGLQDWKWTGKDGRKRHVIGYDSLAHMIESTEKGFQDYEFRHKLSEAGKAKLSRFRDKPLKQDDWTYGSEFPNKKSLDEALFKGKSSKKIMDYIQKFRDKVEGTERYQQLLKKSRSIKRRRVFAVEGAELDIDRVMCGDPDHWQQVMKGRQSNIVKINIDYCLSCGNSSEEFCKIAALGILAANMIEQAGYSVEITGTAISRDLTSEFYEAGISLVLKEAKEPLDIQRISTVGIVGTFRLYTFIAWCTMFDGKVDSGLGQALEMTEECKDKIGIEHTVGKRWIGEEQKFLDNIFKTLEGVTNEAD